MCTHNGSFPRYLGRVPGNKIYWVLNLNFGGTHKNHVWFSVISQHGDDAGIRMGSP